MLRRLLPLLTLAIIPAGASSYYTARLDDPKAVYLTKENFPVHADGAGDDTDAIQQAIDKLIGEGIVFVPEGRYRLTRTVNVWPAVRLIGYGSTRPVFVLGPNTPGYQDAGHEQYLVFFAGRRVRSGERPPDATPGTFYSAMSAWLTMTGAPPSREMKSESAVLAPGSRIEKLAGGFYNISGGAIDPAGDFYFVDAHWRRIYRWSATARQLETVRDQPLDPVNLMFDKAGNLMVVSYAGAGTVYTFQPGKPGLDVTLLHAETPIPRPGMTAALPASDWRVNPDGLDRPYRQYVSPDGSTFIPAGQDFVSGAMSWGVKSSSLLRGFGLAPTKPGETAYITSESEIATYRGTVAPDGGLTGLSLFVNQGGEGVAVDEKGNVYIAAGQIWVYDPAGRLIDRIDVPERPTQLVFGGGDRKTLFIAARSSLYAVRTRFAGR